MSELSDRFFAEIKENKQRGASFLQLRYFFRWKKSLRKDASSIVDEMPWLTFKSIDFLDKILNRQSMVFEFGGGGSTLFFVKRAKQVITIEHDKEWFGILKKKIGERKFENWYGQLIEAQDGNLVEHPDNANPEHYSSDDEKYKGSNFYNYARSICSMKDNSFDVVLIDGRSRPACLQQSIPKVKHGGYLILDNSNREYYLLFLKKVIDDNFKEIINTTGACPYLLSFTTTSVWQKK